MGGPGSGRPYPGIIGGTGGRYETGPRSRPGPARGFPVAAILLLLALLLPGPPAAAAAPAPDLAVIHAPVFDAPGASVLPGRTVLVRDGRISAVEPDSAAAAEAARAKRVLDAEGRLLTPGLIDGHHHIAMVLADSILATGGPVVRLSMEPDSIAAYRRRWARAYLPFGVTSVRSAGDSEEDLPLLEAWMQPVPWAPDFHPCGGALVSHEEGRTPYPGHVEVAGPRRPWPRCASTTTWASVS